MPDIMQTREANKKLKADLFELKSKYYLLKQELPTIRDLKDVDFSEDVSENKNNFVLIVFL